MKQVAEFEIVRELGRGGMGIVYLAMERPIGRLVALKVLHPHIAADANSLERFTREAASVARLSHDSIIKLHRYGVDGNTFFLALEYVDGSSLDNILNQDYVAILERAA